MQKTTYLAMNSFAAYIMTHNGDFRALWDAWSRIYKPTKEMEPHLKTLGYRLCNVDKTEIKSVPESKYRTLMKRTFLQKKAMAS